MFNKPNGFSALFIVIDCIVITFPCSAEVVTDGSLGAKVELSGKHFQITPELGQQLGGNLFHSFQSFNLSADEAATFSGATSVQNVIARVTGGSPSQINGLMRSTIPNADLYFINPYGVMFGQNAKLDLQGGFHVSTADYLKLQDGGQFDARNLNNSLLSVAPVAAFGFLTDSPAPISTQDSMLIVPPMKPLSLIGGHLSLTGHLPIQFDDTNTYAAFAGSLLHTAGSQINLVAVGSAGELILNDELTMTGRGGNITLNHTLVDTSGLGSGNLMIRGGQLEMHNSTLQANTLGEFNGGLMDIHLTESLHASSEPYGFLAFINRSLERGQGGSIILKAPEVIFSRVSLINNTMTKANSGRTDLEVTRLNLLEGASISNAPFGGKSGAVTIRATEAILIAGKTAFGSKLINGVLYSDIPSSIDSTAYPEALEGGHINLITSRLDLVGGIVTSATLGTGSAGNIFIQADNVNITEGGFIATSALGSGLAGNVQLNVTDTIFMSGRRDGSYIAPVTGMQFDHNQSSIVSFSLSGAGGELNLTAKTIHLTKDATINTSSLYLSENHNSINLQADHLFLSAGGAINSSNSALAGTTFLFGSGRGGDIHIQAKQLTLDGQGQQQQQTGILSDSYGQSQNSQGGALSIETDRLNLTHGAAISARSYGQGDAGSIHLKAQHLHLAQSSISTAATQAGGGNIVLNNSAELYLDQGEMTTSVATGQGSGGNITIGQPQFIILNHAQIKAQADAGHGGNIQMVAQHFVPSFDSLISASSNLGIDGDIIIDSPTEDVGNQVLNLAGNFLNAAGLFPRSCAAKIADQRPSQFVRPFTLIVKPAIFSDAPEDARPSDTLQTDVVKFSHK